MSDDSEKFKLFLVLDDDVDIVEERIGDSRVVDDLDPGDE